MKKAFPYLLSGVILIVPVLHIAISLIFGHIIEGIFVYPVLVAFAVSIFFASLKKLPTVRILIPILIALTVLGFSSLIGLFGGYTTFDRFEIGSWEIDGFTDVSFYEADVYQYNMVNIFPSDSTTVIASYSDEDFDEEFKEINEKYSFYTEAQGDSDNDVPIFSVEGFDFGLIVNEDSWYPKNMDFIGVNRNTKEIAFVHFYSSDLDFVSDFEGHMLYDCGWEYIMKRHNR